MPSLTFQDQPNWITQSLAPGDTSWHLISPPSAVPGNKRVNVTAAFVALGAAGAAGTVLLDANIAAPTVGFPMLSGTTVILSAKANYWYKCLTSTDTLYIAWSW